MVQTGYGPEGFIGLMDMLNNLSKRKSGAADLLFATHPMSDERYQTAVSSEKTTYQYAQGQPLYKERYMDNTAKLRAISGAIEKMQQGEKALGQRNYSKAEEHFRTALKQTPSDYTGLVLMSKTMLAQKKYNDALQYAEEAKRVYPEEAQSNHLSGFANIKKKRFEAAYDDFSRYNRLLPGNPNTLFFMGLSQEGMKRYKNSAQYYYRYLQQIKEGPQAKYAYERLVQWKYIK
jgi:predicted Zn-dependent protease